MGNGNSRGKRRRSPPLVQRSASSPFENGLARPVSLIELPRKASQFGPTSKCSSPRVASSSSSSPGIIKTASTSSRTSRKALPHPVTPQSREIIQSCFENPHSEIGTRICNRILDKRIDYQKFIARLGKDKWPWITNSLREYLEEVVQNVESTEKVEELSRRYGEEHVALRNYGFKPDLWVSLADAIITECIILDMANHQPADTVAAWSQLVTMMFSSVRDGYYATLRHQRKASRKSISAQSTLDSSTTLEQDQEIAPLAPKTAIVSFS